jgi:hypothetical protein
MEDQELEKIIDTFFNKIESATQTPVNATPTQSFKALEEIREVLRELCKKGYDIGYGEKVTHVISQNSKDNLMNKNKAIIFLDIDGVLVSYKNLKERHPADNLHHFEEDAVRALNYLIRELFADIVITSAWRIGKTVEYLQEIFDIRGVKGKIIGATPYTITGDRGLEIKSWMESNYHPNRFIIIDDEVEGIRGNFKNWWLTDRNECLRYDDVDYILDRLERVENLKGINYDKRK